MNIIKFSTVRANYASNQPDGHWFDRSTMDFFKTMLPDYAYETSAGILFVTRETNPSRIKRFTVRRQGESGDIETVGEFHVYLTAANALAEIKRLSKVAA